MKKLTGLRGVRADRQNAPDAGPRPRHVDTKNAPGALAGAGETAREGEASSAPQDVVVRAVPIELCQFIKFGGLADSGGAAKQLVAEGSVLLNGVAETRKRRQLAAGDVVTVAGRTIVVRVGVDNA